MEVLCFGNSLTAGSPGYDPAFGGNRHFQYAYWMVESARADGFEGLCFQNHGVPGDLASLMERRLERTLKMNEFDTSVILAGTNDLGTGSSPESVFKSLQNLWNLSIAFDTPVISCTIPPIGFVYSPLQQAQKRMNALIHEYSRTNRNIDCVDLYSELSTPNGLLARAYDSGDGLHLSIDGYRRIGQAVWEKGLRPILSNY